MVSRLAVFAAVHTSIHNHFNQDRHFSRRDNFKQMHSAALSSIRPRRLGAKRP